MNILQILPELKVGGVERGVVDLARYLINQNHKVVVVSGGGRLVKELDMMGSRHYELPVGRKNIFTMIGLVLPLMRIIKNENIDIVHARSRVPAWIAFAACRLTNTKFITTAHGYYRNKFTSQVMGWSRAVIVASNVIARHMIDDFGVPFDRIKLIPRGADLNHFKYKFKDRSGSDEFVIGMISRITPIKGHAYFIKAISMVSRVIPKLRVVIVGEAPPKKAKYREELEVLVRRLGLTRTVEFRGEAHDIPGVLADMNLLVLPTVVPEAFGRVIIEAHASGVPVIATRVGGIVDVIEDGVNGLLVHPEDHVSLQDAIIKLAKDKNLSEELAKNARRVVEEKYSLEKMAEKTVRLYNEALTGVNILVIKISSVGDVVLAVPSLRAIRAKFPNANIKALVGLKSRQILQDCPYIDGLMICDFKWKDRSFRKILKLGDELRKASFDMVVDLQNNKVSHVLSFLSAAPLRYGYKNGKLSFLLNRTVEETGEAIGPVKHQFKVLRKIGIKSDDCRLELWSSPEDEEWAVNFLEQNWLDVDSHAIIALSPGGSLRWATKRWPIENFARLCDEMARRFNARVILTGTRDDLPLAKLLKSMTKSKPVLSVGKTDLMKLASLIRHCRLVITGDSAPMHVAAAVGVPYIALFGPTDPGRHVVPYEKATIIRKDVSCSPCYRPTCWKDFKCMKKITVEELLESVEKHLRETRHFSASAKAAPARRAGNCL